MSDCYHQYGSDLVLGPTGDLLSASGSQLTLQRILRRLLTNQGDYIWHLDYGGGLPAFVGQVANLPAITAVVRSQLAKEASVAQTPAPTITVSSDNAGTVFLSVTYADAATGQSQTVAVPVGG